jgi:hypothetical protein
VQTAERKREPEGSFFHGGRALFDAYDPYERRSYPGEESADARIAQSVPPAKTRGLVSELGDRLDRRPVAFITCAFVSSTIASAAVTALVTAILR